MINNYVAKNSINVVIVVVQAIHAVAYNVGLLAANLESNVSKLGSEIKELDQQVDLLTMQVTFQINF
jgi:uncharacterized protein Yka (UPF0111/DUF47 family)